MKIFLFRFRECSITKLPLKHIICIKLYLETAGRLLPRPLQESPQLETMQGNIPGKLSVIM